MFYFNLNFYPSMGKKRCETRHLGARTLGRSAIWARNTFKRIFNEAMPSYGHAAMPSLFDGHASTITRFAACALFRAWPILIMNVCF